MDDPVAPSHSRTARAAYWLVSIALAAALLYYCLRGVEWARVLELLRGARLSLVLVLFVLATVSLFLRAFRWRVLLLANGPVGVLLAFWATSAGYFGNNFLPARAGELVRTVMVSTATGFSKSFVLTTALSERVADAIVLLGVSVTAVFILHGSGPPWLAEAALPLALVALCGIAGIAVLPRFEWVWCRLLAKAPLPVPILTKLQTILSQVSIGLRSFHHGGRLGKFFALTVIIWALDAMTVVLGGQAVAVKITFPVALLLVAGLGLGSALPSTPGYIGIYQFVAVTVLTPFGISRTDAIAYILFAQVMQSILLTGWGLAGLAKGGKGAFAKDRDSQRAI